MSSLEETLLLVNCGFIIVIRQGSTGTHVTSKRLKDGEMFCDCISYQVRGKCRHVLEVSMLPEEIGNIKSIRTFDSSVKGLNDMYNEDLYSSNHIVSIYALPGEGKTLFAVQEAMYLASKGYNVLYIDTEGGAERFFNKWSKVFESRFGKKKGKVWLEVRKSVERLCEFFGYKVLLINSASGNQVKLEFRVLDKLKKSEALDFCKKAKIDFLILDSLTSPIRTGFQDSTQNFPAKASATSFIFARLLEIQEECRVGVLVTHHASMNPTNPYDNMVKMRGGIAVRHYSKKIIYLDRRNKKGVENIRRFWLVRGEDVPDWSKVTVAEINDLGYNDINMKLEDILTQSEQKRLS